MREMAVTLTTGRGGFMRRLYRLPRMPARMLAGMAALTLCLAAMPARASVTGFRQAVAEAAASDPVLSQWYRTADYAPLWVADSPEGRARRTALLDGLQMAVWHGLPEDWTADSVRASLASARTARDLGRLEVSLSRLHLDRADALRAGIVDPASTDEGLKRVAERPDPTSLMAALRRDPAQAALQGMAPDSVQYVALARERARMARIAAGAGWGPPVSVARAISIGGDGRDVIALRDRLTAMGYMQPSATAIYDDTIGRAVAAAQRDHGLDATGIADARTVEALNVSPVARLGQILVAMERERWLMRALGRRHVWVNLTDFTARLIDSGDVLFETRAVIGKEADGRRTPEFSDVMDHMVVNPSWYVPRSIIVGEYLPQLRQNPGALGHMKITDRNGREVDRSRGFAQYTARTFPYAMRQPPSPDNALGRVKFMFPNVHNIYLHDTPARHLFDEAVRAYSHGCIRLADPAGFAHALLAAQTDDPEALFRRLVDSGREARVNLDAPLPVHIVYRTAIAKPGGGMEYRPDIYGRDARILAALRRAGVSLPGDTS